MLTLWFYLPNNKRLTFSEGRDLSPSFAWAWHKVMDTCGWGEWSQIMVCSDGILLPFYRWEKLRLPSLCIFCGKFLSETKMSWFIEILDPIWMWVSQRHMICFLSINSRYLGQCLTYIKSLINIWMNWKNEQVLSQPEPHRTLSYIFTKRFLHIYWDMSSKWELTRVLGMILPCFVSSKCWKLFL